MNTLTGEAGLKLGPILLETLLKHYFERLGQRDNGNGHGGVVQLRKDELLYDEAFQIIKTFMDASTRHTVEELQHFSNARTPTPPWVHMIRLLVPMSCCDDAAGLLIKALGGDEVCKRVVGGTKWWQVRGIRGVDAEWITAKKDWQEAKRKEKERRNNGSKDVPPPAPPEGDADNSYRPDMDDMRCVLYFHGGGYYFGSVDQERYAIQRFARKINGRVLAINYRLAPQYPFPCAIQDALAAYLFLIRPPEGASHQPVKPEHIVVAGDSAGGGLTLALLQVIRDAELPAPAGGVPISPWCDLTHSFPSIHLNTTTDIIPQYGLSMHKPSTLWPPPSEELTDKVHTSLRERIKQMSWREADGRAPQRPHLSAIRRSHKSSVQPDGAKDSSMLSTTGGRQSGILPNPDQPEPLDVGATAPLPTPTAASSYQTQTLGSSTGSSANSQTIRLTTKTGEELKISEQIQLYTRNELLTHPLVSSALSYLGGLPPLLFIISDKEVLRDEGIYVAHKAAHPEKYPVKDEQREMYPALKGIEERYGPTKVHLQVYDDSAHVLPILFSFTTPAKFCYRSVASFCRHVTGMMPRSFDPPPSAPPQTSSFASQFLVAPGLLNRRTSYRSTSSAPGNTLAVPVQTNNEGPSSTTNGGDQSRVGIKRTMSATVTRATSSLLRRSTVGSATPSAEQGRDRPPMPPMHISEETKGMSPPAPTSPPVTNTISPAQESTAKDVSGSDQATEQTLILDDEPIISTPLVLTPQQSPRISSQGASNLSTASQRSPPLTPDSKPSTPKKGTSNSSDVAGPRFELPGSPKTPKDARLAGDSSIYVSAEDIPWDGGMIRERVSTQGVIRPLESEDKLPATTVAPELIGVVSELAVRRYLEGHDKFQRKFQNQYKQIEKQRIRNIKRAKEETERSLPQLQEALFREEDDPQDKRAASAKAKGKRIADALRTTTGSGSWTWAWALDEEHPPPSSIAARRDTQEARTLARVADHSEEGGLSGNTLWSMITTFLTAGPGNMSGLQASADVAKEGQETRSAVEQMMEQAKHGEGNHDTVREKTKRPSTAGAGTATESNTNRMGRRKSLSVALSKLLPARAKSADTRRT